MKNKYTIQESMKTRHRPTHPAIKMENATPHKLIHSRTQTVGHPLTQTTHSRTQIAGHHPTTTVVVSGLSLKTLLIPTLNPQAVIPHQFQFQQFHI